MIENPMILARLIFHKEMTSFDNINSLGLKRNEGK